MPCLLSFISGTTAKAVNESTGNRLKYLLAKKYTVNYIMETLTLRANPKGGSELGYSQQKIF
jgi:hypothetical protein